MLWLYPLLCSLPSSRHNVHQPEIISEPLFQKLIMPKLCQNALVAYYSKNYASIFGSVLIPKMMN